jgi:hypothetical protein
VRDEHADVGPLEHTVEERPECSRALPEHWAALEVARAQPVRARRERVDRNAAVRVLLVVRLDKPVVDVADDRQLDDAIVILLFVRGRLDVDEEQRDAHRDTVDGEPRVEHILLGARASRRRRRLLFSLRAVGAGVAAGAIGVRAVIVGLLVVVRPRVVVVATLLATGLRRRVEIETTNGQFSMGFGSISAEF